LRLATWNINSLNVRLQRLTAWLAATGPDIVCLQETKLVDAKFPRLELAAAGYTAHFIGQNTYNGVALIVRDGFGPVTTSNWRCPISSTSRSASSRRRSATCASSISTCRTASRSTRTSIATSSTGAGPPPPFSRASVSVTRDSSCWAISTSLRRTATSTIPSSGAGR
jgi:hypothetical protein